MLISIGIMQATEFWSNLESPIKNEIEKDPLNRYFSYSFGKYSNSKGYTSETASLFNQDDHKLIYKFVTDSDTGKIIVLDPNYKVVKV